MKYTKFTSKNPTRLSKRWRMDGDEPVKEAAGQMTEGHCQIMQADNLAGFAADLQSLGPDQALSYGLTSIESGSVYDKKRYAEMGSPADACTRTKRDMRFPEDSGIFMIDYDVPPDATRVYTHEELWGIVCKAVPALKDVGYVTYPSASSYIYNSRTGAQISGLKGQRIYFEVTCGTEIAAAGKRLFDRLWMIGEGWMEVSKAGSLLKRSIIDPSVWQSNRFDFAAGATCVDPLEQRRGEPVVVDGRACNLIHDIPELSESEKGELEQRFADAAERSRPLAEETKRNYISENGIRMAGPKASEDEVKRCKEVFRRAVEGGNLAGDFPLIADVKGKEREIKVLEVLENPVLWHGVEVLDPLENDYDGRRYVGKLFLLSGSPRVYSFAHGGRSFKLHKAPKMIEAGMGRTVENVERVLEEMRRAPDLFEFGGHTVIVEGDKMHSLADKYALLHFIGSRMQFFKTVVREGTSTEQPVDPPVMVAQMIEGMGARRGIKELKRICTAPTITRTGAVMDKEGYRDGLLFQFDDDSVPQINQTAGIDEAVIALDEILRPFRYFPLVGASDRTSLLCAILSAVVRPVIDTCPAFGFDAPIQGSGKTLLAKSVAAIATGKRVSIKSHVGSRDDEEIRKRIMSIMLEGEGAVVWDNIMGVFNSPAMASLLTSCEYSDRLLGSTKTISISNNAVWVLTGNNLQLAGDMPRRVYVCRIDPETQDPFSREFEFDPETYCLERRMDIIAAGITIIKAWFNAGCPHTQGRTASFEQWDDLVRQPIAWLATYRPELLVDPMDVLRSAKEVDPEQEEWKDMLEALNKKFSTVPFTAKDVMHVYQSVHDSQTGYGTTTPTEDVIHECIHDVLGGRNVTARRIGKYFQNRKDRLAGGLRLKLGVKGRDGAAWRVENVDQNSVSMKKREPSRSHNRIEDENTNVPF